MFIGGIVSIKLPPAQVILVPFQLADARSSALEFDRSPSTVFIVAMFLFISRRNEDMALIATLFFNINFLDYLYYLSNDST